MKTNQQMRLGRVMLFAALIGGSAAGALGAMTAALHLEQASTGTVTENVSKGGGMTMGQTKTQVSNGTAAVHAGSVGGMNMGQTAHQTTAPSVLETPFAFPLITAPPFGKS